MVPNLVRAQGTCTFNQSHTHTHTYIKYRSSNHNHLGKNNLSYITCINLTHCYQCYDTHHYISKGLKKKPRFSEPERQKLGTIPGSNRSIQSYTLTYYCTPLQLSLRPLQGQRFGRWTLDRACCCMQLSNSNSPLACVIWRCITMRRHLSSKSSSSFAFFRQSRMSGSVDVGSQCFCRIKPEHYRCTDKTSYGKLQTSEINTQPQTWTLAWRSGAVERAGGRQLGSVSEDTKRSIQHGRSTYLPWSSSCRYAPKHNLRLRTRLSAKGMNTTHELATCFKPSNATSTILLHGQETVWFEEMDSLNCMHFTKTEPLPGNVWERWNTKQNNMKMIKVLSDVWQRQS